MKTALKKLYSDIVEVSWELFKIMVPTLLAVKVLSEIGFVSWLDSICAPLLSLIGLPASLVVVVTTTMLTNPYAGLIVMSSVPLAADFSIGQASILASFMLFTHSLPVELLISRKAGVRMRVTFLIRVGGAFVFCAFLNQLLDITGWLSAPAFISLPTFEVTTSLWAWGVNQVQGLVLVQLIIIILLSFLALLKAVGIEALMHRLLTPFLSLLGVGGQASTIAVVGVTLGLGFGGGLLIKEVRTGSIPRHDVFGVLVLINLLHSVFEDTAVVMLLGPSLLVILGGRFLFTMLVVWIMMRITSPLPDKVWRSMLTNNNVPEKAG